MQLFTSGVMHMGELSTGVESMFGVKLCMVHGGGFSEGNYTIVENCYSTSQERNMGCQADVHMCFLAVSSGGSCGVPLVLGKINASSLIFLYTCKLNAFPDTNRSLGCRFWLHLDEQAQKY